MELIYNEVVVDDPAVTKTVPIYIQGGKIGNLITGGATEFMLDDIDINLDLLEDNSLKNDSHIIYTFKLNNLEELDEWLNSSDYDFLAKCVRKFKLHMSYSNAAKGFFFDIVKLFESYVRLIMKKAGLDEQAKLAEYEEYNIEQKLDSSSIILYKFGKDEDINKYLEQNAPYLAAYIKDKDRWSYAGWCPLVPDIRLRHILSFPLELVDELLNLKIDFAAFASAFSEIKKILLPPTENRNDLILVEYQDKKEKINNLHTRIKSMKPQLKAWEDYYTKSAEQIIDQVKIMQRLIPNFGTGDATGGDGADETTQYNVDEYFIHELYKTDNAKFRDMMIKFFDDDLNNIIADIDGLENKKPTNTEFYNIYAKYKKTTKTRPERNHRFGNIIKTFFKNIKLDENINYVDYGTGEGSFAVETSIAFNINPKNVYCVDITDEPPLVKKHGFNYIKLDINNIDQSLNSLPKIDLITIINVIHHIPIDVRNIILNKLKEKSHSDTYLFVKEHNCDNSDRSNANIISEWHNMYNFLNGKKNNMGSINYINYRALVSLLGKFGFKRMSHSTADNTILRQYFVLFQYFE